MAQSCAAEGADWVINGTVLCICPDVDQFDVVAVTKMVKKWMFAADAWAASLMAQSCAKEGTGRIGIKG